MWQPPGLLNVFSAGPAKNGVWVLEPGQAKWEGRPHVRPPRQPPGVCSLLQ